MSDSQAEIPTLAAPAIAQDLFCPSCGYNLRGLTGDRCPECGESIEGTRSNVCQIPWVHRKELGWWRAYWKTIYFVMFKQKQFANEMARPVRYADSQRFRCMTVAFAYAPVLIGDLILWVQRVPSPTDVPVIVFLWSDVCAAALLHLCFLLLLAAATGVPSYFLHPRGIPIVQQNRAIALSYYACGPLSLLVFPACAAFTAIELAHGPLGPIPFRFGRLDVDLLCWLLTGLLPLGLCTVWCLDLFHLTKRLVPQNPRRADCILLFVPLLWFVLGLLLLVLLPLCAALIVVFASSH